MSNASKKHVVGAVGFCIVFVILLQLFSVVITVELSSQAGLDTEGQIQKQFKDASGQEYTCLILGNSRTYRGINPALLEKSAYNFSHDNDSYNQLYWKLIFLERSGVSFDAVILGTDYFMFSFMSGSRNEIYEKYLPEEYMQDYNRGAETYTMAECKETVTWYEKLNEEFSVYVVQHFQYPIEYLMQKKSQDEPYLKSNGQYIIPNQRASETETIQRDGTRLEIQETYFERILAYCRDRDISIAIVMPPTRDEELKSYSKELLNEFDSYLNKMALKYNALIINYAFDEEYKAIENYMDITHLQPAAADRWTKKLNEDLFANGFFDYE